MGFFSDLFGGAERKAAKAQAEASDKAVAEARRSEGVARSDLQPFTTTGSQALNPLLEAALDPGDASFERSEGFEDIQKSAAARGKLSSGNTLKSLTEFNTGINERFRGERFNRLLSVANLGQNSAAGQANVTRSSSRNIQDALIGKGDAIAAGKIGAANRTRSTVNGLASFLGTL